MLTFYGPIGTITKCGSLTIESYGVESCVRNAMGGGFGNTSNCSVGWAESVAAEAGSLCAFYSWDELC
jgi:hypothetical protein